MKTAFDIILFVAGVVGLGVGVRDLLRARNSRRWPVREGRILEASIRVRRAPIGGGLGPVVRYEYQHQGIVYEGTRLVFSGGLALEASRADVEQFLVPLQKGAEIAVHVSPRDPRISVVKPGVDRRLLIMIFVASWFVVVGLGGVLEWWN